MISGEEYPGVETAVTKAWRWDCAWWIQPVTRRGEVGAQWERGGVGVRRRVVEARSLQMWMRGARGLRCDFERGGEIFKQKSDKMSYLGK